MTMNAMDVCALCRTNCGLFVCLLSLALTTACTGPGNGEDSANSRTPGTVTATGNTAGSPTDIARQVVAQRTGSDPAQLEIISSTARNFSDSGLGCPVEGRAYLQVITPGHQVIVRAEGRDFDVRVAGGSGRICEQREDMQQRINPTGPDDSASRR